jgi:hypothetical protein
VHGNTFLPQATASTKLSKDVRRLLISGKNPQDALGALYKRFSKACEVEQQVERHWNSYCHANVIVILNTCRLRMMLTCSESHSTDGFWTM